jgi:hypothetical protein
VVTAVAAAPQERRFGKRNRVTAADIVRHILKAHKVKLASSTIRSWATRGQIGTYGRGRERYDLREVVEYATQQGIIPKRD